MIFTRLEFHRLKTLAEQQAIHLRSDASPAAMRTVRDLNTLTEKLSGVMRQVDQRGRTAVTVE